MKLLTLLRQNKFQIQNSKFKISNLLMISNFLFQLTSIKHILIYLGIYLGGRVLTVLAKMGTIIRNRRKELGYSQEYVALSLITNTTRISHIENGKVIPDILEVLKYTELYSMDIKAVLGLPEKDVFFAHETEDIISGIKVLDRILSENNSTMLKRWIKTIHTEISEIMEESQMLNLAKK